MLKRITLIALLLIISAGLTVKAQNTTQEAPLTRAQRAEIRFLEGMIDHHQMAVDMATHCLDHAETDTVLTICQNVIAAQTPEIEQMAAWLLAWYGITYTPVSSLGDAMDGMDMGGMDMGGDTITDPAMTMGMMAGLDRYTGQDYAVAWLEAMIDHHDDALHMAQRLLRWTEQPELIELANAIIRDQWAEIRDMEQLLDTFEQE
ncbi:MAG: DUF305 domain-containing protein [Anaerolinea sp.]|nr:DUF305 domain-containing protein [Anaerolinea sp.]